MNQKEGLKAILDIIENKRFKLYFLTKWLEDINWHSENALLIDKHFDEHTSLMFDLMENLAICANEKHYSVNHYNQLEVTPEIKAALDIIRAGKVAPIHGFAIDRSLLLDYLRVNELVRAYNYIYGWGLDSSFKEHTGEKFINELIALM